MSKKTLDAKQTWGQGIKIDLPPGAGWVLYADHGPSGPCGQGMSTTCPHGLLMTFPDEDTMRQFMENEFQARSKKHWLMWGVVDSYTAGGVFRVVQHQGGGDSDD
jgi:hypothetical protein